MKLAQSNLPVIPKNKRFCWGWGLILLGLVCLQISCVNQGGDAQEANVDSDSSLIIDEFRSKFESGQYLCVISYSSECPIAKSYIKTIQSLHERYKDRVTFCLLNPGVGGKSISGLQDCVFHDPQLFICNRYGIKVYPQVVLVNCLTRKVMYAGKIDDRAVSLGVVKSQATIPYLEMALSQLVEKGVVHVQSNEAIGCFVGDIGLK